MTQVSPARGLESPNASKGFALQRYTPRGEAGKERRVLAFPAAIQKIIPAGRRMAMGEGG